MTTPHPKPGGSPAHAQLHADFVERTLAEHGPALLGLARRVSVCADDAHDAYQRTAEIFLRRADSVHPETAVAWLRTVVKHEALAVRRARILLVGRDEEDFGEYQAPGASTPDEEAVAAERRAHAGEALRRLKPDEARALWLKAKGMSYREIAEASGWTFTKVNRCLTEGRKSFLDRYAGIESGSECDRWAPVLSAIADGEATPDQLSEARPHLRNCAACRATVREFHAVPRHVAAFGPAPLALGAAGGLLDQLRQLWTAARHAVTSAAARLPLGPEASGAGAIGTGTLAAGGAKAAALCVSVTVAAGGAYCLDQSGALPAKSAPPVAAAAPADRDLARAAASDRQTDRDARAGTTAALAPAAARPTRREPRRASGPGRTADAGASAPESPASEPGGETSFESGTSAAPSTPPASPPAPPDPAPAPAAFDGGFEAD